MHTGLAETRLTSSTAIDLLVMTHVHVMRPKMQGAMKMVGLLTALSVAPTLALAPSGRSAIVAPSRPRATPVVMSKWLNQGPKPKASDGEPKSSKLAKVEPKELAKFEPLGAPSSQMQANSAAAAAAALAGATALGLDVVAASTASSGCPASPSSPPRRRRRPRRTTRSARRSRRWAA